MGLEPAARLDMVVSDSRLPDNVRYHAGPEGRMQPVEWSVWSKSVVQYGPPKTIACLLDDEPMPGGQYTQTAPFTVW